MTTKQQDDMARALTRAYASGLDITGQGRMRNGNRFFTIPSATDPSRSHLVVVQADRLHCDCPAGQNGTICQHRALAHEYLVMEAAKRAELASQAEDVRLALAESAAEDALHAAAKVLEATINAPIAKGRGQRNGPRLKTDTKAFSIFK
jgi:hypothetical protein